MQNRSLNNTIGCPTSGGALHRSASVISIKGLSLYFNVSLYFNGWKPTKKKKSPSRKGRAAKESSGIKTIFNA